MTEAATPIEAKKHGLRQSQDGHWTLTLILHPSDTPDWLLTAPMGQRLALVVAALKDEAEKKSEPKERKRFDEMPLSQQCALRCGDAEFQRYISNGWGRQWVSLSSKTPEDTTANVVRWYCAIASRSELDRDEGAARKWQLLDNGFLTETGRVTECRG